MAFRDAYLRQLRLLMRVLPIAGREPRFALKGGTAINLFVRDLPRLSVDLDLVYLPTHERAAALSGINDGLLGIASMIRTQLPGARVATTTREGTVLRLLVTHEGAQVKIEVSPVLRGTLRPPALRTVSESVEAHYGFAEVPVVSFEDLYAGKLVAALDRQHPRDLFDVRELLASEGLSTGVCKAFLVYLVSHNRPMGEVLSGRAKDIRHEFAHGFDGMTAHPVSAQALERAREALHEALVANMPEAHRDFLIGFERGEPDWTALPFEQAHALPAVRWRERNLARLDAAHRAGLVKLLRHSLGR